MKTPSKKLKTLFFLLFLFFGISITNAQNPVSFILVNADTDTDIRILNSTDTVYYSNTFHISIRIEHALAEYVTFVVNGLPYATETVRPFAIQGDKNGNYYPYKPTSSNQSIRAKIGRFDVVGGIITERTINVHFVDTTNIIPPSPSITTFYLVDAQSDQDIRELVNGDVFNISHLPPLNIRVTGNIPSTGSVIFIEGTNGAHRTENQAPYAVYGDINGDYQAGNFGPVDFPGFGTYTTTLTATPFSGPNGSGVQGQSVTISYTVIFGLGSTNVKVSTYPNPVNNDLTISVNTDDVVEFELYDLTGKIFYKGNNTATLTSINLDQLDIPKGIYFLKSIFTDKTVEITEVIKN